MTLTHLIYFSILCAATHWLLARAEATRFLWSRAPGVLDKLLRCAGCSGVWIGAGWTALWCRFEHVDMLLTVVGAVLGAFVTPIFEGLLLWGLQTTAIEEVEESTERPTPRERPITPPPT